MPNKSVYIELGSSKKTPYFSKQYTMVRIYTLLTRILTRFFKKKARKNLILWDG